MKIIEAVFVKPTDIVTHEFEAGAGRKICLSGGGAFDRVFGVRAEDSEAAAVLCKVQESFPQAQCRVTEDPYE